MITDDRSKPDEGARADADAPAGDRAGGKVTENAKPDVVLDDTAGIHDGVSTDARSRLHNRPSANEDSGLEPRRGRDDRGGVDDVHEGRAVTLVEPGQVKRLGSGPNARETKNERDARFGRGGDGRFVASQPGNPKICLGLGARVGIDDSEQREQIGTRPRRIDHHARMLAPANHDEP